MGPVLNFVGSYCKEVKKMELTIDEVYDNRCWNPNSSGGEYFIKAYEACQETREEGPERLEKRVETD